MLLVFVNRAASFAGNLNPKFNNMKKLVFATLLTTSLSVAFAQNHINKGSWMLGGSAGFSSQKQDNLKTTDYGVAPDAGYFFINNFAGGLRTNISGSKSEAGTVESKTSGFEVAPFVRYYFLPASQKLNLFADASYGFGKTKDEGAFTTESQMTTMAIKAGPAIFLTPATALEIALGYQSMKIKDVDARVNNFGVNIGFQIHIPGSKKK